MPSQQLLDKITASQKVLDALRIAYPTNSYRISARGNVIRKYGDKWQQVCEHNKAPSACLPCDGNSICKEHRRIRTRCVPCGGGSTCKHKRQRQMCPEPECNGSQICWHKRQKSNCKECNEKYYCDHGNIRGRCHECPDSSQICPHDKIRQICRVCTPEAYCEEHGCLRRRCIPCGGGSQICPGCNDRVIQREGFCTVCHPNYVPTAVGVSRVGCLWLDEMEAELGEIQHSHYDPSVPGGISRNEFRPPCMRKKPVDGCAEELIDGQKVLFEFLGDEFHGHPRLWHNERNLVGKLHAEVYRKTEEKFKTLHDNGYTIIYIWECDYRNRRREPLMDRCRTFDGLLQPRPE